MAKFLFIASAFIYSAPGLAAGYTFFGQWQSDTLKEHSLTLGAVCLLILGVGLLYRRAISQTSDVVLPDQQITLRNLVEAYGSFIMKQCKAVIGEEQGPRYFSFLAALFLVIWLSNLSGVIPGFLPPTDNLNTTLALGAVAFIYYNFKGAREQGVVNYLKHFAGPVWYMAILIFPIEIISNLVRPLSLALRLRGNMYGDHLVLGIFSDLRPEIVPIVFLCLGILVSTIQAYVFTMLTMVYISLAVSHHHDHDDENH